MIDRDLQKSFLYEQWEKIGIHAHHGICIILSSIYTKKSCGIGEFYDLLPLINWIKKVGMDVIQLLPINDSGDDPSPYNAESTLALHPIYLSLRELPYLEEYKELKRDLNAFTPLTKTKRISFHRVKKLKERFLHKYYRRVIERFLNDPDYEDFKRSHDWLIEYALFKTIKKIENNKSWSTWKKPFRDLEEKVLFTLSKKEHEEIEYHIFLQYLSYKQLSFVKSYAEERGIFLKGDIPFLLSKESADVWFHQESFLLEYGAGAPPDTFNPEGQYWGFPLFNWERAKKDQFKWWHRRLSVFENYFHIYRIDHLVGFFRVWAFSKDDQGFIPKNRHLWPHIGKENLEGIISKSSMLPIAEDLGTIPKEVPSILRSLGMAGIKMMQWERYWAEDGKYIPKDAYEPISLTTVSTHDTKTLGEWWQDFPIEAKVFAKSFHLPYKKKLTKEVRYEILRTSHSTTSLFHINLFSEYLQLIPSLSWKSYKDDRINIPGTNLKTNWRYRLKAPLETILSNEEFAEKVTSLLE